MNVTDESPLKVPVHLGLILDGNRRWAKQNNVSVAQGHRRGYQNLKDITKAAIEYGVKYVSAYVFSTENWQREPLEVKDLMKLSIWAFKHEIKAIHKDNVRLRVLSSRERLSPALLKAIDEAEALTAGNTRATILLCLDYGGQLEIVDSVKRILASGIKADDVSVDLITQNLYAPDVPPPDLIIRTSGEQRLSNFMTWQSVYSELMFTNKLWPDFSEEDLLEAFKAYTLLQRRFGK